MKRTLFAPLAMLALVAAPALAVTTKTTTTAARPAAAKPMHAKHVMVAKKTTTKTKTN